MKSKNKKILKAAVVALAVMMVITSGYAVAANKGLLSRIRQARGGFIGESNIIELDGSIIAEISNDTLGIVSPTIDLQPIQVLDFNVSKVNNTYWVNNTLRINISVTGNASRQFLIGRHLTTFVSITRKYRGWLFRGKPLNIVRTNILTVGEKYIDVPLNYEIKNTTSSEDVVIHIFALGSAWGIITSTAKPVFEYKAIDTEIRYSFDSGSIDITAPVTLCALEGEMINGTYVTDVTASLYPDDGGSGISYTMYRYSYCYNGISMQTLWGPYTDPIAFSGDGNYSLDYYSVDNAGNQEEEVTNNFSIQHM